jgi:hypothetical protein
VKPAKYRAERRRKYANPRPEDHAYWLSMWTCEVCGKQSFASRRLAKLAAERAHPGYRYRFYTCNDAWHMTSVPAVKAEEYRQRDFQRRQNAASDS